MTPLTPENQKMDDQQMIYGCLSKVDKEVHDVIQEERGRQREGLELIASENFASVAVLQANSSVLTNKYSEGYPGQRYYGGTEFVDKIETLCQKRALEAFGLNESEWGVNVQALSGSPANFAVYTALIGPNGKLMGLDLPSGGHLTHGYQTGTKKISASSLYFRASSYFLNKNNVLNYEQLEEEFKRFMPDILICGASAYSRHFDYKELRRIADTNNSSILWRI
jgi:glycine hydroxymethyltransferase